jgi:hypothetical protein
LKCGVAKDGEDQLDRPFEKRRSFTKSQGGEEYPTYNKKRECTHWSHLVCETSLLKHIIEEKIEEISGEKTRKKT